MTRRPSGLWVPDRSVVRAEYPYVPRSEYPHPSPSNQFVIRTEAQQQSQSQVALVVDTTDDWDGVLWDDGDENASAGLLGTLTNGRWVRGGGVTAKMATMQTNFGTGWQKIGKTAPDVPESGNGVLIHRRVYVPNGIGHDGEGGASSNSGGVGFSFSDPQVLGTQTREWWVKFDYFYPLGHRMSSIFDGGAGTQPGTSPLQTKDVYIHPTLVRGSAIIGHSNADSWGTGIDTAGLGGGAINVDPDLRHSPGWVGNSGTAGPDYGGSGVWITVQAHYKADSGTGSPAGDHGGTWDGIAEVWKNGVLFSRKDDVNWSGGDPGWVGWDGTILFGSNMSYVTFDATAQYMLFRNIKVSVEGYIT